MEWILKLIFLDYPETLMIFWMIHILIEAKISFKRILMASIVCTIIITFIEFSLVSYPSYNQFLSFFIIPFVIKAFYKEVNIEKIIFVIFTSVFGMIIVELFLVLIIMLVCSVGIVDIRENIFSWILYSIPIRVAEILILIIITGTRDDIKAIIKNKLNYRRSKNEKWFTWLDRKIISKIGIG